MFNPSIRVKINSSFVEASYRDTDISDLIVMRAGLAADIRAIAMQLENVEGRDPEWVDRTRRALKSKELHSETIDAWLKAKEVDNSAALAKAFMEVAQDYLNQSEFDDIMAEAQDITGL